MWARSMEAIDGCGPQDEFNRFQTGAWGVVQYLFHSATHDIDVDRRARLMAGQLQQTPVCLQ